MTCFVRCYWSAIKRHPSSPFPRHSSAKACPSPRVSDSGNMGGGASKDPATLLVLQPRLGRASEERFRPRWSHSRRRRRRASLRMPSASHRPCSPPSQPPPSLQAHPPAVPHAYPSTTSPLDLPCMRPSTPLSLRRLSTATRRHTTPPHATAPHHAARQMYKLRMKSMDKPLKRLIKRTEKVSDPEATRYDQRDNNEPCKQRTADPPDPPRGSPAHRPTGPSTNKHHSTAGHGTTHQITSHFNPAPPHRTVARASRASMGGPSI